MKKIFFLLILLISVVNASADTWTQKASVSTRYLRTTTSFSIGTKGYVCCCLDSVDNLSNALWEYDQIGNVWAQKANYGGGSVDLASAFGIQGKGYVGLGEPARKDWWEYDPIANVWTQKSDFGGGKRSYAVSFSIFNKGYIFGGYNDSTTNFENDLWEYNPSTDIWTQKTSCPGSGRESGIAFSLMNKGYVGGGVDATSTYLTDFWAYDPLTDSWTSRASIPTAVFVDNGYFSIGNYGYVTCGEALPISTNYLTTLWQYNSLSDQWVTKASFPGASRDEVASFSIGNYGYAGWGGKNGVPQYNDFYEYTPDSADMAGIQTLKFQLATTVYPNPFTDFATINFGKQLSNVAIEIIDASGKEIKKFQHINGDSFRLNNADFRKGIYFYTILEKGNIIAKNKFEVL